MFPITDCFFSSLTSAHKNNVSHIIITPHMHVFLLERASHMSYARRASSRYQPNRTAKSIASATKQLSAKCERDVYTLYIIDKLRHVFLQ